MPFGRGTRGVICAALLILCIAAAAGAQRRPRERPDVPQVLMAVPLAVAPGGEVTLTLRGRKLDGATAVRVEGIEPVVAVEIRGKGKAEIPNQQDAKRVGDTQVEVSFALPTSVPGGHLSLVVTTPEGETEAYELRVEPPERLADEKEPNDGFERPQDLQIGQVLRGMVEKPKDVDVYRFSATAGQTLVIDVAASQRGSGLDPLLMVFDADGRLMATSDDGESGRDATIEFAVPRDGAYLATVIDANDAGGPAHPYLLSARVKP